MRPRLEVEPLEGAVEIVHEADVVAVHVDRRVLRLDLQPYRAPCRRCPPPETDRVVRRIPAEPRVVARSSRRNNRCSTRDSRRAIPPPWPWPPCSPFGGGDGRARRPGLFAAGCPCADAAAVDPLSFDAARLIALVGVVGLLARPARRRTLLAVVRNRARHSVRVPEPVRALNVEPRPGRGASARGRMSLRRGAWTGEREHQCRARRSMPEARRFMPYIRGKHGAR